MNLSKDWFGTLIRSFEISVTENMTITNCFDPDKLQYGYSIAHRDRSKDLLAHEV
jgi:hypothetical protein